MVKILTGESPIREKYQTTIPQEIREKAKLDIGDSLIWEIDDESGQIVIMVKPKNFTKAMKGLGKELWEKTDTDQYLHEERESWGD
ncbi:MAG: AbrB/MazE/SpoVT family DNA-binding domain-containing protein [Thermincolia bacterium]